VVAARQGRGRDAGLVALAAAATWTLVQLPALGLGVDGWWHTVAPRLGQPAGYGSLWGLAADGGNAAEPALITAVVVVAAVGVAAAVALAAWSAPRGARVAQVTVLLLVGWLVIWPVYSPQQVLWLLPFAVLARPRWRDLLIWQAGEVVYYLAIWTHLSGATLDNGAVDKVYGFAIVLRLAAEIYLAVVVLRDLREPAHDPVRAAEVRQRAGSTPRQA
jgi:uncharacterized membrane protein